MTGTPDDRFDDHDLDRLLAQLPPPPPMREGLVDHIVGEAQRADRVSTAAVPWKPRTPRRAWTRRGVRTGVIALNLIFASAVAAAFGGGVLSVAKIRAIAATIVEHVHHPHGHAVTTSHDASVTRKSFVALPRPRSPTAGRVPAMPAVLMAPHVQPAPPAIGRHLAQRQSTFVPAGHGRAAFHPHHGAEHLGLRGWDTGRERQSRLARSDHMHGALDVERPVTGTEGEPRPTQRAFGAGERPEGSLEGGWRRATAPDDYGHTHTHGEEFSDGWRQRPWQRRPDIGARRFGRGGGFEPGPRARFGFGGGGRPGGRGFRRRY